jgi:hypothetical protein
MDWSTSSGPNRDGLWGLGRGWRDDSRRPEGSRNQKRHVNYFETFLWVHWLGVGFEGRQMSDSLKLTIVIAIGFIGVYWLFVMILRSAFGIELPDPADQLPYEWRSHIPRTL